MKKLRPLSVALGAVVLAVSGCSAATSGPGTAGPTPGATSSAATTAPTTAPTTGWELDTRGGAERIKAAGLPVLNMEGAAEHFHAHLDVFVDGKPVAVPADIGFSFSAAGQPDGISALHTHDESGIIHIEAPAAGDTYTLGQILTEWGVLDGTGKPGTAHSGISDWTVAVNGAKQDGPAQAVVLKAHDEIVLFHGTAPDPLPATFTFPAGV
ncbi:hypothetical protein [Arthrobacter sp. PM3]|uniref:hypothetical protein n=1 Tax=Arthrobacter sp. PM3 TaxID=2017685 RepID=UPI000E10CD42|nr:hypothetical protein [Arthrobacter sp. PM3]AXJ09884.1 hypothetical protein CFN17_09805 [Arthrobacter sp. PM3]